MRLPQPAIISILLLCTTLVHSYEINALQTGTVVFEEKLIRLNTCMSKKVQLKLTKEYYQKNKDINVVVSISGLKMDDQLTFYIYHNLNCNKRFCELEINVQRYNLQVNQKFNYQLTIDYLLAHGIKTVDFNMTYYKQHFQIPIFEENMNVQDWSAILMPYGFSDLKLLGNVKHQIIVQSAALKLTYLDPDNLDSQMNQPSWTLSKKFVLYKVLFLPKEYLRNRQNRQLFTQFVGFASTKSNQVVSQLYLNNHYEFIVHSVPELPENSYFRIPIKKTSLFFENRRHSLMPQNLEDKSPVVQSSSSFSRMLFGVCFLVTLQVFYLVYKKKMTDNQHNNLNQTVVFPDLLVSFEDMSKNLANKPHVTQVYAQTETNQQLKKSDQITS